MRRLPEAMRAAAIDRFGGPAVLKVRRLPLAALGPDEVLIAVHTAGVASWDAVMRAGWWPLGSPRFPLVLGTDGSGVVAAVGSKVRRLRAGDRVIGYDFEATSRSRSRRRSRSSRPTSCRARGRKKWR